MPGLKFRKSKKSPAQTPNAEAPTSASDACTHCSVPGHCHTMPVPEPALSPTPSAAPTPLTAPMPTSIAMPTWSAPPAPTPQNERINSILNGANVTLTAAAAIGSLAPVPWLKNIATVTKTLVEHIQTALQNDELLRELLQRAIALGQCMMDAVEACFKTSDDGLPDYFSQHLALLHDTLKNVEAMCHDLLKAGKVGKTWNVKPNQAKIEEYRRSLEGGLDFFSLRSNIAMEAHFLKLTNLIEKRYPLGGYIEKAESVPQTSKPEMTFSPSLSNTFTCAPGGYQYGNGLQTIITGQSGRAGDTYYQLPPVVGVPYAGYPFNMSSSNAWPAPRA